MEATKQVKFDELLDNFIDMSKVKLDALKAKINTKIYSIFKIEDFVYKELKLEQFICPMRMHIHITEFLNGSLVKQFICELWPILLAAEEIAVAIPNNTVEPKKDENLKEVHIEPTKNEILNKVFSSKLRKDAERSQSRCRKQDNMSDGRKEPPVPHNTLSSTLIPQGRIDIEKNIKHHEKHDESASLSRSTSSRNSGTESGTQAEQKQPLVPANTCRSNLKPQQPLNVLNDRKQPLIPPKTLSSKLKPLVPSNSFGSSLKPKQRVNMLNGGKLPQVPPKTLSSKLKPQGRINISKVKLDVLKPWISKKIADILEREDNVAVEFVYNKLKQDQILCKQKFQIRIAGFLNGGKAQKFVCELWPLLLSAQESESGIPAEMMQQKKDENVRIGEDTKHTNAEHKQHLTTSTLSSKNQQPDKENNKNSMNIKNQIPKQGKSASKDNRINKNKSSKRSADYSSHPSEKLSATGAIKNKTQNNDGTCGLNGFANICMYSPQQKNANASTQDQHRPSHCAEMDEFLKLWNEAPDKETILLSTKFIYPDEKNIEKQIKAALLPSTSSVTKSDHKQHKPNIDFDKVVNTEDKIKAAGELQSRKRSHSTMICESKKLKNNSSDKDEKEPAKKKRTKTNAKKASSKRSSDKASSRKPEAKPTQQAEHNEINKLEFELFGSISSDEEECSPGQPSAKNSETKPNNRELNTLELDLSISSDEEDV